MRVLVKVLMVLLGLFLVFGLYVQFSDLPKYVPQEVELKIESDSLMITEGARLSSMLCSNCHMSSDNVLAGRLLTEAPPEFGTVYSANITGHKENGIGSWTDGEIACLLRTGVKRDGSFAPFYMPRFTHLTDRDLHCIIAYLRSEKREVRAVDRKQPTSRPSFLVKFLCRVAWKPFAYPSQKIVFTDTLNLVAYGKYLVTGRYDCYPCHSADFTKVDFQNPENTEGFLGGGNKLIDLNGEEVYSANISSDKETGIGNWDYHLFRQALVEGKGSKGVTLRYPMLPYTSLRESETRAIFAYLRQVPEINNPVERTAR